MYITETLSEDRRATRQTPALDHLDYDITWGKHCSRYIVASPHSVNLRAFMFIIANPLLSDLCPLRAKYKNTPFTNNN